MPPYPYNQGEKPRVRNELMRRRSLLLASVAMAVAPVPLRRAMAQGVAPGASAESSSVPKPGSTRMHGLSLVNDLHLPAGFPYFPYVNPNAPKGGELATAAIGSFDSFNPFIVRGTPTGAAIRVFETLMVPSSDEAVAAYVHLATVVEIPADNMGVAFELHPDARFHDGHRLTAEDVVWTFNTLRKEGRPFYGQYYADVENVVAETPLRVVFHFKTDKNRELAQILGEMPILPKHWWAGRDFDKPLTDPPLGSGPYRIGRFEMGRTVVLERVPDYWGAKLPTAIGLNNFDILRTEYFRDMTVAMEAFKAGQVDLRRENSSKNWATAYDFPAIDKGLVKKESIPTHLPTGMQGFAMNTRRAVFKNEHVRNAMIQVFDFEWMNKNLFYDLYTRTNSYFSNSDFASSGLPTGDELALLDRYRDKIDPAVFTRPYVLPVTDGSGNNRAGLLRAIELFKKAGWEVVDRRLRNAEGQGFGFEILLTDSSFERITLPYVQSLQRLGMDVRVRTVDPAQYQRLIDEFDFDMTIHSIGESDSPGNEQMEFWSCAAAKAEGSENVMGICDPVVDALVGEVLKAHDHAHLVTATRALDRVLLAGNYIVPQWNLSAVWVAYWDRFGRPDKPIRTGIDLNTWWLDTAHATVTDAARRMGQ